MINYDRIFNITILYAYQEKIQHLTETHTQRNIAVLEQCVQQLKSLAAILAKTFEKVKEIRIDRECFHFSV